MLGSTLGRAVACRWLSWRNTGAFLDDAVNVVAAGKPGVDKSHALAAIPNELVAAGPPGAVDADGNADSGAPGRQA